MPSNFSLSLARFLELYRHARTDISEFLDKKFDAEYLDEARDGEKASFDTAAARTLDRHSAASDLFAKLRAEYPDFNPITTDYSSFRSDSRLIEDWAREFELGSTEEAVEHLVNEVRRSHLEWAGAPDFQYYFGLQFAAHVDGMVEKVTGLEELEYRDIVSDSARQLLMQAHQCYLRGFDEAVTVLCGSVLETTLKERLMLDWKLEQLLIEAEDRGLLKSEEWGMGDLVRELRNEALHRPLKFSRRPANEIAVVLSNTRAVVKAILATKSGD